MRHIQGRVLGLSVGTYCFAGATLCALADTSGQIDIQVSACAALKRDTVLRLSQIEFADEGASAIDSGYRATIRCTGSDAILSVLHLWSQKTKERKLELGRSEPEARARLVVIAIAELVAEFKEELATPEADAKEGERASLSTVSLEARRLTASEPREKQQGVDSSPDREPLSDAPQHVQSNLEFDRLRVLGLASTRVILGADGALWGGGVRLGGELGESYGWAADLLFERGRLQQSAGAYKVDAVTAGLAAFVEGRLRRTTARLGAGLRAGITAVSHDGAARSRSTATAAPWGWPMLTGSLTVEPGGGWLLEWSAESGYALLPVTPGGSQISDPALRGIWFSSQLGLGLIP